MFVPTTAATNAKATSLNRLITSEKQEQQVIAVRMTLRRQYAKSRKLTWKYQDTLDRKHSKAPSMWKPAATQHLLWLVHKWHDRAEWHRLYIQKQKAQQQALAPSGLPPHYSAWLCIHKYEGSWTDGGSPYYGGLQMDIDFQASYGGQLLATKGTADHWSPLEQMWVAERAYSSGRGFYPWPNTARTCGLI